MLSLVLLIEQTLKRENHKNRKNSGTRNSLEQENVNVDIPINNLKDACIVTLQDWMLLSN